MHRLLPLLALTACIDSPAARFSDGIEPTRFALPLAEPGRFPSVVGVDHDPVEHLDAVIPGSICEDYVGRGFPHCYDQHDGSDFILQGGFPAMDDGSTLVLAAADGVVVSTESAQYDRCHADLAEGGVSCDGRELIANHVILEHADGTISKYWHFATDSLLVEVDQTVACGDPLGLVGSSGNSSMPHLHFEIELEDGTVPDPYVVEGDSWWVEQGPENGLPGTRCQGDAEIQPAR